MASVRDWMDSLKPYERDLLEMDAASLSRAARFLREAVRSPDRPLSGLDDQMLLAMTTTAKIWRQIDQYDEPWERDDAEA